MSINRSPERKVEAKKFVKFEPKRKNNDIPKNLVGLLKNSSNS